MPAPQDAKRRRTADGILEAVAKGGSIQIGTLQKLCALLIEKTDYQFHIAVEIKTGAVLRTIDNETDARETISRLQTAKDRR